MDFCTVCQNIFLHPYAIAVAIVSEHLRKYIPVNVLSRLGS